MLCCLHVARFLQSAIPSVHVAAYLQGRIDPPNARRGHATLIHCWVPPNQPGRSASGHYVILTLMPDNNNARAYDLLSVGTSISKDNLNLVCLLTRWGQGDSLGS